MKKIAFCFVILFFSCFHTNKKKDFIYIISAYKTKVKPPQLAYNEFNIIIDSLGAIYYYQLHIPEFYDDVYDSNFVQPFINLKPENVFRIPDNDIIDFVKNNILDSTDNYKPVSIAALSDTIKSHALEDLFDMALNKSNHLAIESVRRATQEEKTVLNYKKKRLLYSPYLINWDTTTIKFAPKPHL